jgi:EmrB/QacA subfamily drug resistance transporter
MPPTQSPKLLLWLVAIGFFMQTLDSTIVNTALPAMARSLGERPLRMQSVVVAYALTMAMLIPASGWLADRFGTRRVYFTAIATFVLGSLCCAFSQNLSQLVAARVLQGAGGAMLMPIGRLSVLRAFPRDEFLRAMSFVTMPALIGPLLGPSLGGWIVQVASWPWIFLINVPVGVIGLLVTRRFMPDSRAASAGRFDLSGYLMLAFGMVGISLALDGLAGLGMATATVRVLLIIGLASIAAYALHAVRAPQPLFAPALFRVSSFSVGLLGNLFARIGSGAMPFLMPLFLQLCLGYTPFEAGLALLPLALAALGAKPVAPWLIRRVGYRYMLVGNTALIGALIASFALTSLQQPLALRIVQLALFGFCNSLQFSAMNTVALKDLPPQHASAGNGLLSMVMMLAMSLGVATAGALLANFEDYFSAATVIAQTVSAFHATFVAVGIITLASAWIFWQLSPDEQPPAGKVERVEVG